MINEDQLAELCSEGKNGVYLNVHAQPGAGRAQLRGLHGASAELKQHILTWLSTSG